jgi:hypothetical protein
MNFFSSDRSFGLRKTTHQHNHRRRRFRFERLEGRAMLAVTAGDFNGDGMDDMVAGSPFEDLPNGAVMNGKSNAGAVNVIYGGERGLTSSGNQFWHQDASGINGVAASGDFFGTSVAAGDFNNDGFDDLAIGAPGDVVGGASAGSVNVIYGSASGLRATGDQLWNQNSSGINDVAEANDQFGAELTTGDFNGDGFDDLAIGAYGETVGSADEAGAVNVLYGSSTGLRSSGDQFWHQNVSGINDTAQDSDHFGVSLVAGDFNDDGRDDLAIGVVQEDVAGANSAGAVNVIYGSSSRLTASGDQLFTQDTSGINDAPETTDFFGGELAAGDFNGNGVVDLAIAAIGETGTVGAEDFVGMVHILFGGPAKLAGTGSQSITRVDFPTLTSGVGTIGRSLAAGDFDNNGFDDLSIGAHGSLVAGVNAGIVWTVYGSAGGLLSNSGQIWSQNSLGIQDSSESGDGFGAVLAAGDFDGDRRVDLIVGAPFENLTASSAGLIHVIHGFLAGLTADGNQIWAQGEDGILGDQEMGDSFGR